MNRVSVTIVFLAVLAVFALQPRPTSTKADTSSLVDACSSYVTRPYGNGSDVLLTCPAGDGPGVEDGTGILELHVMDPTGTPIADIPRTDIWLIDCDPSYDITLCGGSGSSDADSATNLMGITTISTTALAAGGCATGLSVVVQGVVIAGEVPCTPSCFNVEIRSLDSNGDLYVDIADVAEFANAWPPNSYVACQDVDGDDEIGLRDFTYLLLHYTHSCEQGGSQP